MKHSLKWNKSVKSYMPDWLPSKLIGRLRSKLIKQNKNKLDCKEKPKLNRSNWNAKSKWRLTDWIKKLPRPST